MKRARHVIGWTSLAAMAVVAAVVFGVGSPHAQSVGKPGPDAAQVAQEYSSRITSIDEAATTLVPQRLLEGGPDPLVTDQNGDTDHVPSPSLADEEATAQWVREETAREIPEDYSLLLKHLGLTLGEEESLLQFLLEDAIARTRTRYSDGIGMAEHERSARIAEIIGETKLQQFLTLEHNLGEYREVQYVQSDLQEKGNPLTDTQHDRLLKIMIDTREQVDMTRPAQIKPRTMESLEYTLTQLDEYDRLVVELASSVLSAKQLEQMFERNQNHSYNRANTLEIYNQRRADNPNDDLPLGYPAKRD